MKATGYIRVSSEMQVEAGHSLAAQRALIVEYAQRQGWTLAEIFEDAAQSGTVTERPGLQALLKRAEQHEIEIIIVASLDRFCRHLSQLLTTLEQLRQQGVALVTVTENLDFTTPWGKLELAVLGSLAEIYVDRLRVETKRGKQA